jgi:hypothetical protein
MTDQDYVACGIDHGRRRASRDFEVDDLLLEPFAKALDRLGELIACLELGVDNGDDIDIW